MCGLTGILGPGIQWADLDILNDLVHVISLRGMDGTGVVQGKIPYWGNGKIENLIVEKSQYDSIYFKNYHKYHRDGNKDLLNGVNNNFFAVHARAPTIGAPTKENSHPFDVGNLIGMHNGTLKDKKYQVEGKTDSEMMFRDMEENGIEYVLEHLDPRSAYAVVILDKENKVIHFARNSQRSLYFCMHKSRSTMYWASELWMLRSIIGRHNEQIRDDDVYYFSPNTLYTIDPSAMFRKVEDIERKDLVPKYTINKNEQKKSDVHNLLREYNNRKEKKEKPRLRLNSKGEVVPFPKTKETKNPLIPKMFCCGCSKPLTLVDQYFGKRYGTNTVICNECDDQTQSVMVH